MNTTPQKPHDYQLYEWVAFPFISDWPFQIVGIRPHTLELEGAFPDGHTREWVHISELEPCEPPKPAQPEISIHPLTGQLL